MSTKTWILVVAFAAGCQAAQGVGPEVDAGDKMTKPPPPSSGGGGTSAGCGGVTERGECRNSGTREVAVSCDVAANQLRQIDCTAIGKHCVVDTHRGASCEALMPPPSPTDGGVRPDAGTTPPRPDAGAMPPMPDAGAGGGHDAGASMPMCPSGIDFRGYCWGDLAVWCDPATGTTYLWACPLDGKHCGEDECATGAYCCANTSTSMPDAAPMPPPAECDRLGYAGECSGMHARWCSGGSVIDLDCAARNQVCTVDGCASGAYCCDPPVDECTRLGLAGECGGANGNTARWCSSGTVTELDCTAQGKTCQVDACAFGAYCCP